MNPKTRLRQKRASLVVIPYEIIGYGPLMLMYLIYTSEAKDIVILNSRVIPRPNTLDEFLSSHNHTFKRYAP
jgi:predicted ATP-grasp superfamily ATP-dependent carboligase